MPNADIIRADRDEYSALNAPVLFDQIAAIKAQLTAAAVNLGSMASDSDFSTQQAAIAAILTAGASAINAASPNT